MKIEDVKIDSEFKALIDDGHTVEQIKGLLDDIRKRGFRDPITVWKENGVLLDGHTRYELWAENFKGKSAAHPYVIEESFASRKEAMRWMILNQISRRNLNSVRAAYYRGKLYNELKLDDEANLKPGPKPSMAQSDPPKETAGKPPKTTAQAVAEQTGSSAAGVKRDGAFAAAVETIAAINSKAAADIRDGKLGDKKSAVAIAKLSPDAIGVAIGNLRNGRKWNEGLRATSPSKPRPRPASKSELKDLDKAVGAVSRALLKAGKSHGEGAHYKAIFDALAGIKKHIAEWSK